MRNASRSFESVLHTGACLVVAATFALAVFCESLRHLFSTWPDFRLGFSALLAHGLALYPQLEQGPVVGDIYGPLGAIYYLPTLLAPNITAQVWLAEGWTLCSVGGLLVAACALRAKREGLGVRTAASVALVALTVMFALPGLKHCLLQVHVDAPSLLFGSLSCMVWRGATRVDLKRSLASAFLLSLSILAKQSALFILAGQVALLALRFGPRRALVHAAFALAVLGVTFLIIVSAIGAEPSAVWFYTVTVPSKHGLMVSHATFVLSRVLTLALPVLAFAGALWLAWPAPTEARGIRTLAPAHLDWSMLAAAGLAMMPISFLATVKVGGYLNNVHAHYYLLLACCLALIDRLARAELDARLFLRALTAAVLGSALLLPNDLSDELDAARGWLRDLDHNPHQLAYDYLAAHRNAYFPWHTLAVAEAQGLSFTSFDGLRTLAQAGIHVRPGEQVVSTPPHVKYVVFPIEGRGIGPTIDSVDVWFPGYRRMREPPAGLERFIVFAR